jgi:hypothetical protein
MKNFSELFLPDFQQSQRYHNELLKHATQQRFTRRAGGSALPRLFSFGTWLRLLLANLRGHKTPPSRTSTFPS